MNTKKKASTPMSAPPPQAALLSLIENAIGVVRTARKHGKSLSGANYYADKLADLRAQATIAFGQLSTPSVGDTTALAELMQKVFSTDARPEARLQAARELRFSLKTSWAHLPIDTSPLEQAGVFPLVKLNQTNRGYLVSVGRQINGCYASGWYDGCAVMMRRLLESSIIEAYEARHLDAKIKDQATGDFYQLTALISAALNEPSWNLPRNVRRELPNLRDLGHRSAHNRYYLASKPDIDRLVNPYRETVEAFLHLGNLL